MSDGSTVGVCRLLDRHPGFQRAGGEIAEHRFSKPRQHRDPIIAITTRRGRHLDY